MRRFPFRKTLLITKFIIAISVALCSQVSAAVYGQTVSLTVTDARLSTVFEQIHEQTGFDFVYTDELLKKAQPVTIAVKNVTISKALELCFQGQPLKYSVLDKIIIVEPKTSPSELYLPAAASDTLHGKITNEQGTPIPGTTVRVKGTQIATISDDNGNFILDNIPDNATLIISNVGYQKQEIKVNDKPFTAIRLSKALNNLDEAVVIAYGKTTQRLNTGDVSIVTAKEIEKQPVSNPLASLEGRVPGLIITQGTGVPGSSFKVQVRGRNSIAQGNDPLFVVDGVPYAPGNENINALFNAATFDIHGESSGSSPFNYINPSDIESISVLKDADATAIYGSRGANGVILITTKKGKAGKTTFNANIYTGISKVTREMKLLNTQQYLAMRREAFKNDNVEMTEANAYDLLLWDTTRYTNWEKEMIGEKANMTDGQVSVSGGNTNTQFLVGANFHWETTVYPGNYKNSRGGLHFNLSHSSANEKFGLTLTGSYIVNSSNLPQTDFSKYINLIPNFPALTDSIGNTLWSNKGRSYGVTTPASLQQNSYNSTANNLISNLGINYELTKGLNAKVSMGYNSVFLNEQTATPSTAYNPIYNLSGTASFANTKMEALIIEPQLEYEKKWESNKLNILIGGSYQENKFDESDQRGANYSSDELLGSLSGAGTISASNTSSQYKYVAAFGRINYNIENTYIFNITGRRDGSSRFGPGKQFANFGALGTAWIFTDLNFFENHQAILSYGKLKASYGTSGNDNIGDYQYFDSYSGTTYPYQGVAGLYPSKLSNADYSWEINKKLEVSLDLGFLHDRVLLSANWYRNRSNNQLVEYPLPSQVGFGSITENLPALVQNTGWEFQLNTINIRKANFKWTSGFNISIPRNKLISFPNLASSSYRNQYEIGKSLNIRNGFNLVGVDPQTGLYVFVDKNGQKSGTPLYPDDIEYDIANLDPKFYGGFDNQFSYKNFELDVFLEFREQTGFSYLQDLSATPGLIYNQPLVVLNRWQKPGDRTNILMFTESASNPAYQQSLLLSNYTASNYYTDASYIRIKNISLSYNLPKRIFHNESTHCRIYVQGQNLFVITSYLGNDPETQLFSRLPPLKTLTAGIQLTL